MYRKPYFGIPRRIAPTLLGPVAPAVAPAVERSSKRSSKRSGNVNICIDKCYEKYGVASPAPKNPFAVSDEDNEYVKLKKKQKNDFNEMISRIEKNYGEDTDEGVSVENLGKRTPKRRSKKSTPVRTSLAMPKPTSAQAKENRRLRMEKRKPFKRSLKKLPSPRSLPRPTSAQAKENRRLRMEKRRLPKSPPKKRGRGRPRKLRVVAFGGWFSKKKEENKPNEEEARKAESKKAELRSLRTEVGKQLLELMLKAKTEEDYNLYNKISVAMPKVEENEETLYTLFQHGALTSTVLDESQDRSMETLMETLQILQKRLEKIKADKQ